jgi:hypothetical protein
MQALRNAESRTSPEERKSNEGAHPCKNWKNGPPTLVSPPSHRHFERSRPTFSSPFASCEWVGLHRKKSLFPLSCQSGSMWSDVNNSRECGKQESFASSLSFPPARRILRDHFKMIRCQYFIAWTLKKMWREEAKVGLVLTCRRFY